MIKTKYCIRVQLSSGHLVLSVFITEHIINYSGFVTCHQQSHKMRNVSHILWEIFACLVSFWHIYQVTNVRVDKPNYFIFYVVKTLLGLKLTMEFDKIYYIYLISYVATLKRTKLTIIQYRHRKIYVHIFIPKRQLHN